MLVTINRSINTYLGRLIFLSPVLNESKDLFGTDSWQKISMKTQKYVFSTQEQKRALHDELASRPPRHQKVISASLAKRAMEKFPLIGLPGWQAIPQIIRKGPLRNRVIDGSQKVFERNRALMAARPYALCLDLQSSKLLPECEWWSNSF